MLRPTTMVASLALFASVVSASPSVADPLLTTGGNPVQVQIRMVTLSATETELSAARVMWDALKAKDRTAEREMEILKAAGCKPNGEPMFTTTSGTLGKFAVTSDLETGSKGASKKIPYGTTLQVIPTVNPNLSVTLDYRYDRTQVTPYAMQALAASPTSSAVKVLSATPTASETPALDRQLVNFTITAPSDTWALLGAYNETMPKSGQLDLDNLHPAVELVFARAIIVRDGALAQR